MRLRSLCAGAALAVAVSACYPMAIDATGVQSSLYMAGAHEGRSPELLQTFEAKTTAAWLLWGLAPLRDPDVAGELLRATDRAGGNAVTGLTITTQQTFIDGLLSVITLGIYGQRTTILRGTVARVPMPTDNGGSGEPDLE